MRSPTRVGCCQRRADRSPSRPFPPPRPHPRRSFPPQPRRRQQPPPPPGAAATAGARRPLTAPGSADLACRLQSRSRSGVLPATAQTPFLMDPSQPALIGRQGLTNNTIVYQYRSCTCMPSCCTDALHTFSHTVSTNQIHRLRTPTFPPDPDAALWSENRTLGLRNRL